MAEIWERRHGRKYSGPIDPEGLNKLMQEAGGSSDWTDTGDEAEDVFIFGSAPAPRRRAAASSPADRPASKKKKGKGRRKGR